MGIEHGDYEEDQGGRVAASHDALDHLPETERAGETGQRLEDLSHVWYS